MRMVRQMRKLTFSAVLYSFTRPAPALIIAFGMSLVTLTLWAHVALAGGVVGNGSPGSCTGDLLAVKLTGGGLVTFDCGGPATLSLSNTQTIALDTTIDGSNNGAPITLTAPIFTSLFHVNGGVEFTLENLTVADVKQSNGTIYNFGGHVVVSGSTFLNNANGAILNEITGSTIVAVGSLFSNTVGSAIGDYAGTAFITGSQFISNSNAIYGSNGVVSVANSYFSHNQGMYGAGIEMNGSSTMVLTVTGSTFYSNTGTYGSAIYADIGATTYLSNNTFTANDGYETISLNWGASAGVRILSSAFLNNTGGAVGGNGGTDIPLVIADTSFIDNDGGTNAGAINAGTFSTSLVHDTFIGNHTSSNFPGALNAGGPITITGSTFIDNVGLFAGAMYLGNAGVPVFEDRIANSLVQENQSTSYNGGGISVGPSTALLVSYVNVLSNTATSLGADGAGLYFDSYGTPQTLTVTHSLFFDNSTANGNTHGGGLYIWGNALIVDSTIVSNTAGTGGGVYMGVGTHSLVNDTIADNKAYSAFQTGGDVFNAGLPDSINALNTILTGGTPKNCGGVAWLSLGHNLSSDASCPLTHTGDLSGTAPLLGRLQNNGGPTWTLLPTLASSAIDAGANAGCPADDQRGLPRPHNRVCDIGAVEYQGSVSRTFVPITMR
jgi:hypothetical protein